MDADKITQGVAIIGGIVAIITQIVRMTKSTKAEIKWNDIQGKWQKFLRIVETILISSRNKKI